MRTKISDFNWFVVYFFDARQMKRCFGYAETQRKRVQGGFPLVDPPASRATHKNATAFLIKRARFESNADFAFAVSKKRRKRRDFYGKKCEYTALFPLRHPERSAAYARGVEWISQRFFLVGLRLAPAVSCEKLIICFTCGVAKRREGSE